MFQNVFVQKITLEEDTDVWIFVIVLVCFFVCWLVCSYFCSCWFFLNTEFVRKSCGIVFSSKWLASWTPSKAIVYVFSEEKWGFVRWWLCPICSSSKEKENGGKHLNMHVALVSDCLLFLICWNVHGGQLICAFPKQALVLCDFPLSQSVIFSFVITTTNLSQLKKLQLICKQADSPTLNDRVFYFTVSSGVGLGVRRSL